MWMDVSVIFFGPRGSEGKVMQVDAVNGDDAASQVELRASADGRAFQIRSIVPSGEPPVSAAVEAAEAEPEDAPEEPLMAYRALNNADIGAILTGTDDIDPVETPAKRGPGRPRKVAE